MPEKPKAYVQSRRLAQRRIAGELFVVDPANRCLHQPEGAGENIWGWLKTGCTQDSLVEKLLAEYDVPRETAERDVRRFLRELRRKRLIEETSA